MIQYSICLHKAYSPVVPIELLVSKQLEASNIIIETEFTDIIAK